MLKLIPANFNIKNPLNFVPANNSHLKVAGYLSPTRLCNYLPPTRLRDYSAHTRSYTLVSSRRSLPCPR